MKESRAVSLGRPSHDSRGSGVSLPASQLTSEHIPVPPGSPGIVPPGALAAPRWLEEILPSPFLSPPPRTPRRGHCSPQRPSLPAASPAPLSTPQCWALPVSAPAQTSLPCVTQAPTADLRSVSLGCSHPLCSALGPGDRLVLAEPLGASPWSLKGSPLAGSCGVVTPDSTRLCSGSSWRHSRGHPLIFTPSPPARAS